MRSSHASSLILVSSLAVACGGGSTGSTGAGGGMTTSTVTSSASSGSSSSSTTTSSSSGGPISVTVSPNPADLLTCKTQKLTATVTNAADPTVTWSVMPSPEGGAIAADGTYSAPLKVPASGKATVTAKSNMDPMKSGTADITLATVHPKMPSTVPLAAGGTTDVYAHRVAIGGQRGYAVRSGHGAASPDNTIQLSLSTDGGATWAASKNVSDSDPTVSADCAAVAVDPGDPKVAYIVYRLGTSDNKTVGCPTSGVQNASGTTLALAVTKDGGATFTRHTLASTYNGYAICPDVVAPSPGHVVVTAPNAATSNFGIDVYASATKGDDLSVPAGCTSANDYTATLQTPSANMFPYIAQNGGSSGVSEAPAAFTDGNGAVCVTFSATTQVGVLPVHAWIMCSKDNGTTWTSPVSLDKVAAPTGTGSKDPRLPHGAFGPNGAIAVGWWFDGYAADGSDQGVYVSTSAGLDAAGVLKPFTTPILLEKYTAPGGAAPLATTQLDLVYEGGTLFVGEDLDDGGGSDRVAVDKSCDGGVTWSGIQLVNGPEGSLQNMLYPEVISVGGGMNLFGWDRATQKTFQIQLEP